MFIFSANKCKLKKNKFFKDFFFIEIDGQFRIGTEQAEIVGQGNTLFGGMQKI